MPFIGTYNETLVTPHEVPDSEVVLCPRCETEMGVKASYSNQGRWISRHFYHKSKTDCGGESDIHARMKTIAASRLREWLPEAEVVLEKGIVPGRVADVVAVYDPPVKPYGKGIAVEVQHKNKDKEHGQVMGEYLGNGYSILWAYQSDFDGMDFEVADHRFYQVWPHGVKNTEGREYYPEIVVDPPEPSGREIEVPIPGDYLKTHRLDIASPQRFDNVMGWTRVNNVSIHGKGAVNVWVNLWKDGPTIYAEFWRKDNRRSSSDWFSFPVNHDDGLRFQKFGMQVEERFESGEYEGTKGSWQTFESMVFEEHQGLQGEIVFASKPSNQLAYILKQYDTWNNERTWVFEHRKGDPGRIEYLGEAVVEAQEYDTFEQSYR